MVDSAAIDPPGATTQLELAPTGANVGVTAGIIVGAVATGIVLCASEMKVLGNNSWPIRVGSDMDWISMEQLRTTESSSFGPGACEGISALRVELPAELGERLMDWCVLRFGVCMFSAVY